MTAARPIYFNGKFYSRELNGVHRVADRLIRECDARLSERPPYQRPQAVLFAPADSAWLPELRAIRIERVGRGGQLWEQVMLARRASDGILVNLASSEMKRLFDWKRIRREARIITPEFRIREGDRLKTIVVYTKMCRGEMTRHLIRNRIADPEMLKEFEWEGFRFDAALSRGDDWTFTM